MLELWNGSLISAVIGGLITGFFMIWQQWREFGQRAADAMRALLVEVEDNKDLVIKLEKSVAAIPSQDVGTNPRVPSLVPIQIRRAM